MLKMKKMLMFLLLLGGGLSGYSREHLDTASLAIYYRQGRSSFDAVYRNNGTRLDAFMERFRRLQGDTLCSLRYVHVVGGSSPEGGRAVNERLARLRARQMERRLESDIPLADSLVEYSSSGVDWEGLTSLVETSGLFCREQALDVLRNAPERTVLGGKPVDSRKRQLMTLYGGRAWTAMSAELFPSLRSARIRAVYDRTRLCDLPMWKRSETSFRRASETVNEMRGGVMGLDSLVGRTEVPDSVRAVMTQVVEVLRNSVEAVSSRDRLDGLLARLRAVERPDSVAALSREAAEVISEAEEVLSTARKRLATATDGRQQAEQITSVDSLGDSPQTRTRFAALCGTVFDSSREVCEAASVWERHEAELTDLAERTERLFRQPDPVESAESAKKPFYMSLKTNLLYDLALVPNLGAEFYVGRGWSLGGTWMYAWWKNGHRHRFWRIYGGELDVRSYIGRRAAEKPLTGHHVGFYLQAGTYDFATGGTGYLCDFGYGAGLEYGYALPIGRRLNLDFGIGFGYFGGEYETYEPADGHYVWRSTRRRHWFGPTRAEISLIWLIGAGNRNEKKGGKR